MSLGYPGIDPKPRVGALLIIAAIGWDGDWEWLRDCEEHATSKGRTMVEELALYHDSLFGWEIQHGLRPSASELPRRVPA